MAYSGTSDEAARDAVAVETIAAALRDVYGEQALAVAERQRDHATGAIRDRWATIASLLAGR